MKCSLEEVLKESTLNQKIRDIQKILSEDALC
jgi:hypothetical protein